MIALRRLTAARIPLVAAIALALTLAGTVVAASARAATYPIEAAYAARGTWAVSTADVDGAYTLYYPTELGAGGFRHPIITWGNGTNATPSLYPGVLNQLASWGFVVIASTSTGTGTGNEILAGAEYLVARNGDPASMFHQKLDTENIGAVGHSQGAGGSVRATLASNGLITTVVPVALPDPAWVSPGHEYDVSQLTVPVLFLGGVNDFFISPPRVLTAYYNQVPGAAAKASLRNAGHNTIQNTGGGFLGYLTAWFMYRLRNDAAARGAFAGSTPEINGNTKWSNQAGKNLS
ncbi:MAG TPA: hypothetical protein VFR67_08665 [Pilimelia sp.]|nr:hypothetical protein [Pilimelia sp.]